MGYEDMMLNQMQNLNKSQGGKVQNASTDAFDWNSIWQSLASGGLGALGAGFISPLITGLTDVLGIGESQSDLIKAMQDAQKEAVKLDINTRSQRVRQGLYTGTGAVGNEASLTSRLASERIGPHAEAISAANRIRSLAGNQLGAIRESIGAGRSTVDNLLGGMRRDARQYGLQGLGAYGDLGNKINEGTTNRIAQESQLLAGGYGAKMSAEGGSSDILARSRATKMAELEPFWSKPGASTGDISPAFAESTTQGISDYQTSQPVINPFGPTADILQQQAKTSGQLQADKKSINLWDKYFRG